MSLFNDIGNKLPSAINYATATVSQKAAELGGKLVNSGMSAMFGKAVVNNNPLDAETQARLDKMIAEGDAAFSEGGVPASLFPNDNRASTNELKVKISQDPAIGLINEVVFAVMPRISESRNVEYDNVTPVHHPGSILKYKSTGTRAWTVNGRLMSRTATEAEENLNVLNMIRSWTQPFHGVGTANDSSTAGYLGAPPPILTLQAYGPQMIGPVKCVLKSYNWDFDNQLDYITTLSGNPFPVLLDISLSLEESWSPAEYSGFDLAQYKLGLLGDNGAFRRVTAPPPLPQVSVVPNLPIGAGAGRGGQGGPTAEELRAWDNAQFKQKAAAANINVTGVTEGGAVTMYRNMKRQKKG